MKIESIIGALVLFLAVSVYADLKLLPYPKHVASGTETIELPRCELAFVATEGIPEPFARILGIHKSYILGDQKACISSSQLPIKVAVPTATPAEKCESEAYELDVTLSEIQLSAECPVGLIRALTTLSQLIQKKEASTIFADGETIYIENVPIHIKDSPRFEHRGIMIDTSRHFLQMATLKRIINGMMQAKLNVLHWHMVDDDSFPIQSKNVPGLGESASFSAGEMYTIDQIKEVVQFAKDHGVRVIPEIDCPGHSRAVGLFKPLKDIVTCFDSVWPYRLPDYYRMHGGPATSALDPTMDQTYDFVTKILKDLLEYFKDDLIHLGGDEVMFSCWRARKSIEEFMQKHNIPDYQHLMNYFIDKVRGILRGLDSKKKTIYWSNPDTFDIKYNAGDILQYWGTYKEIHKLESLYPNNKFILSPFEQLYLDCGTGNKYGGPMWCGNYKTWLQMYMFEPTSYSLSESKILGAEACAWGEQMSDANIELKLWPRVAAMAETLWMPKRTKEVDLVGLAKRMTAFSQKLNELGIPSNAIMSQYCEMHPEVCFQKY